LGEVKIKLIDHISVEKKGERYIPTFDEGIVDVIPELEDVKKRSSAVRDDIRAYLDALGEYDSVQAMTERLLRLKRTADNLDRDVANLSKQAVTRGVERPQDDAAVMNAAVKRDRVAAESSPEIADLEKRITRVKEIL
jgi:archaellum component FlaC